MRHHYLAFLAMLLSLPGFGQVVTSKPAIVQRSTDNIVITFHADRGNRGLAGVTSATPVYAHTGVILEGSDQWQHAPSWGDNAAKYKMTYAGTDTWTLTIPSIKSYYGLTDAETATVEKLAFVFRTGDNSKEGKDKGNADIFVPVEADGFAVKLSYSPSSTILSGSTEVTFTVNATNKATLNLYVDDAASSPIATASDTESLTFKYNISKQGNTTIIATGNDGEAVASDKAVFTLAGASAAGDYPGGIPKMGVAPSADGSATFCIAAPGKKSAMIIGDWNGFAYEADQMMKYQDYQGNRYFWITMPGLADGKDHIYYFMIDNSTYVADPYAQLVLDPWNDKYISNEVFPDMPAYPSAFVSNTPVAVYNSKMNDYDWQVKDFKGVPQSQLVVYELLLRDFTGTENKANGEGTISGALSKLDYLQNLGVNAIELMPIMEFNGNNSWGYNTNFYFAPDKAYGTPDDYKLLVDECHKRGMAVILDIVFNQTDGLHPWYMMYDIADNPFYNGSAPHAYSVLNDWNQDNPLVQQQFKDAVRYWLKEYKVDGYRFDLVKGLGSNQSYDATYDPENNTWGNVTDANTNKYNASRVARMKELHNAMREVNPDAYFINENLAGAQEENEMAADGEINWANINHDAANFVAGISANANLNRFYAPLDGRTWGSTVSYGESHDEERIPYFARQNGVPDVKKSVNTILRRSGSLAAIMLTTPGAHMIWQFQELGADESTKNSGGNNTSPKKVVWNYLKNAHRAGLHQTYKELCHFRADNPQFFTEGIPTTTIACSSGNWNTGYTINLKAGDGSELYLVVNATISTATVALPGSPDASALKLISASYNTTPTLTGNRVNLTGGSYAIYGTSALVGVDDPEADNSVTKALGGDGRIVVNGNYDNIEVFTLTGRATGPDSLSPGVYIVVVDGGNPQKVLVR